MLQRELSLDEFAALLYKVPDNFTNLSSALPIYPDSETQRGWTGNDGVLLLQMTAMFTHLVRAS